ncbi:VapE domain-containing protein [Aminobacter ciceronei]|uniref:P-loop ATPase n=1 Tax=Aminobacter ciceronei TaxID=150723 RepID=A0ABR6C0Q4_9HYPH|nr:VapE domain-containing protein [Aminobacter ciceronei]MBA8904899.1 putative P-loop ATPase [Aminobacter ciceronei]MBA9018547.1 putative P-loop ATPase [Aminobacter ciceronei]
MSEIDRLRREVSLSDTARGYGVDLQENGNEWEACCPFHSENTPSFTIFTGNDHTERYHCFGCGSAGDVVDFVKKIKGVSTREAIGILGGGTAGPNILPQKIEVVDIYARILPLPAPREIEVGKRIKVYNPKRAGHEWEWGNFTPSMVFPYFTADGATVGYVLRREFDGGRKETPMVCWVRLPTGEECWSRFPFPRPRPLYVGGGKSSLRDGQVVVVEGEKCADAMVAGSYRQAVSWAGGTFGIWHTDWSQLAGRSVIIWPDADEPGVKTANEVAALLAGLGCSVKVLDVSGDLPKGFDVADAVRDRWTKENIDAFMKERVRVWTPTAERAPEPEPEIEREPAPAGASRPIVQAKTTQQEQPQSATVTSIQTRRTVQADDAWQAELVFNEEGRPKPGVAKNWMLFLENHPKTRGVFGFDAFKMNIMLMRCPPWEDAGSHWEPRTLRDTDYANAAMWLEGMHLTPKATTIQPVIAAVAEKYQFDRLREYLDGLTWDGQPRIRQWLADYVGCAATNYNSVVGMRFLISAVARGLEPGCKVDTMPILEGPQGAMKSTVLRDLFGKSFFTDELSDIGSKDAMMEMAGVWGIEVAEMHRFNAAETNNVKKFLSRQADRYRPPYGRSVIEVHRRVVLAGTINPEGNPYLRDSTGARRFWPVTVGTIDLDAVSRDRDQLWAEAVAEFRKKTPHWIQPDEVADVEAEQAKRTDVDVWTDAIADLAKTRTAVYQNEILKDLGIPLKDANDRHAARIGRVMKKLGWEMVRDRTAGEDRVKFVQPSLIVPEQETLDW